MTITNPDAERLFSGPIAAEYEVLQLICPAAAEISRRVGECLAGLQLGQSPKVLEIGCGTGITTLSLLHARDDINITALDNEPAMLKQAKDNLAHWLEQGRVELVETDALSGLQALPDASVDAIATGYAVHNFLQDYRRRVLEEVHRVLRPGGAFINGDRYALDDSVAHTRLTQQEVRHWFEAFTAIGRQDLLEQWVIHLFSDESEDHIMRLGPALASMKQIGFDPVEIRFRDGVNTLMIAFKTVP